VPILAQRGSGRHRLGNEASVPAENGGSAPDDTRVDAAGRRLLPIALAYLPVVATGAVLTLAYDVGASPEGDASDLPLRGSPLAPPLFLPVLLTAGAVLARRRGRAGAAGAAFAGLVGVAFVLGSTLNLPNDLEAARAAGSPRWLTYVLAAVHLPLGLALAGHAALTLSRRRGA
jgi:hypothetical protein